jgi:hypothetical protein
MGHGGALPPLTATSFIFASLILILGLAQCKLCNKTHERTCVCYTWEPQEKSNDILIGLLDGKPHEYSVISLLIVAFLFKHFFFIGKEA